MELETFKEYIAVQLDNSSLRRIPKSKISWLWHDEDELLRYQPDLLHGFHQRFVVRLYCIRLYYILFRTKTWTFISLIFRTDLNNCVS